MSRADIAFWNAVGSLPITLDGVNDGMWALILIIVLVLMLTHDTTKPRNQYLYDYRDNHPPRYPPFW